jgi:hypothetical protein
VPALPDAGNARRGRGPMGLAYQGARNALGEADVGGTGAVRGRPDRIHVALRTAEPGQHRSPSLGRPAVRHMGRRTSRRGTSPHAGLPRRGGPPRLVGHPDPGHGWRTALLPVLGPSGGRPGPGLPLDREARPRLLHRRPDAACRAVRRRRHRSALLAGGGRRRVRRLPHHHPDRELPRARRLGQLQDRRRRDGRRPAHGHL